jgi:cytochrome c oxidase subunit III
MSTLSSTITIGKPHAGRGGDEVRPPSGGGGDDGRGNAGDYSRRLRRARLGIVVAITPIVMLFVSFTSAYIVRQGLPTYDEATTSYVRDWLAVSLPSGLLMINTVLLVLSSITIELARRQLNRQAALAPIQTIPGVSLGNERTFPWLNVTAVLGIGFLAGQFLAWRTLGDRGFFVATSPSSSFVYLLTASHAVHLAGGLLALAYAVVAPLMGKTLESRRILVDVTVWYWHFMAVLWIYIFALLELAR